MMRYKLVIAEKPSVAQSLAAVIGATARKDGYLEGNGWRVSWCVGHLAGLADADSYDPKYAKWRYDDLPILPEHWQMVVGKDKKKQFDILKKLMNAPDVTEVVNACDAGREGELIFRSVYELADCQKPFHRLLAACQLIDAAEDQLALASGITGIYYLRHIRGIHQLFENIKLLFLILSHYHLPMLRQDRQVIISPLGILGVIAVCICKASQMAHAPADTPTVTLQIPVLTSSCTDYRSQTLCNRWFFSNHQFHNLQPPILPAQVCAVFSLCCFLHPVAGYNQTGSHSGTVSPAGH